MLGGWTQRHPRLISAVIALLDDQNARSALKTALVAVLTALLGIGVGLVGIAIRDELAMKVSVMLLAVFVVLSGIVWVVWREDHQQ